MATLLKLTATLPPSHSDSELALLRAALVRHVSHGWEEESPPDGGLRVIVHFTREQSCAGLALELSPLPLRLVRESVEEENWAESWKEFFTPVKGGEHFLVLAPWMDEERAATGRIPIIIDPGIAFGTGHHASTALCLEAISLLAREKELQKDMRFLDLGTGSGILAIACARLGLRGDGLDTDQDAVDSARKNREANGVAEEDCRLEPGSIEEARGPYDIVLANILAAPLMDMAPRIAALSGGAGARPRLALSGILDSQADEVERAYREQGFARARRLRKDEWTALIFAG